MNMWTIAGKNLIRRPTRSGLTAGGLAVAVAAVVALVGVADSLENSLLELYTRPGSDVVVQRRGGAVQLAKGIRQSFGEELREIPHVREVIGTLMDMVAFEEHDLFMVLVNGWEPNCSVLDRVRIISGRRLRDGDGCHVMLGKILAAKLGTKTGDTITLYGRSCKVVGVFESFSVYENGAVFILLDELQRQMDRRGEVTGFAVNSDDRLPGTIQQICQQIEALDPAVTATPCAEFVSSLSQMRITRTMSWFTAAFAIVIGGLGMMNTMAMAVFERRGEIASLRALGWRKGRVARLVLGESLCLSILGAAVGVGLGFAIMQLLGQWRRTSGLIDGSLSWSAVGVGCAVAILIAILGGLLPAWRCVRLPLADTLRAH